MKRLLKIITPTIIATLIAAGMAQPLFAGTNSIGTACDGVSNSSFCASRRENANGAFAASLTNTLLFVLGIVAVVMIIVGGIKYATANGDASKVKSAKDTVMYSVVGLIVAIMAWGIVTFVVGRFG